LGAEVKLVKGSGGVFDVVVDGAKIYSKFDTGRFPEPGEVVGLLRPKAVTGSQVAHQR
jgi:selenoprotein W-related protein